MIKHSVYLQVLENSIMEGLVLAEYIILLYFLVMCLIIVGVAATRVLATDNPCVKEENAKNNVNNCDSRLASVYNIPWQSHHFNSKRSEVVNSQGPFPKSTNPCNMNDSSISKDFSPIYAEPYELSNSSMVLTPGYVTLSSLGLKPKKQLYGTSENIGSEPLQIPVYGSRSFVGPRYCKPIVTQAVPDVHYKVPQKMNCKPVAMTRPIPHPRIAAIKAQSTVPRSLSPCRFAVNGDLYAKVYRKSTNTYMNTRTKQQLIYTF